MAEIGDLNPVDDSNTARWPENMPLGDVNNAGRADEGILARWHRDWNGSLLTAGTSTAYTLAATRTLSAYYNGLRMSAQMHTTCGDDPFLNVDSVASAAMVWPNGVAIKDGELPAGAIVTWVYEEANTRWQVVTPPRYLRDVPQAEAEAGTETTMRAWSAERVWQAAQAAVPAPVSRGHIAGLDVSTSANVATIQAGESVDGTQTQLMQTALFTKDAGATFVEGTGNGGFVSGESLPVSGTVHLWQIAKTDGTVDFCFNDHATSGLSPTLPTGFTLKRRIRSLKTATSTIVVESQFGDYVHYNSVVEVNSTAAVTNQLFTCTSVPAGIRVMPIGKGRMNSDATVGDRVLTVVDPSNTATFINICEVARASDICGGTFFGIWTNTNRQLAYTRSGPAAVNRASIDVVGYFDPRGKYD